MGELIELDAYRPHYCIGCECGVHVVPDWWLQELASGNPDVEPLPPCLLRAILRGWLSVHQEV